MASITQRIDAIKQPFGGYIKPSEFDVIKFDDGIALNEKENIHSSCIGMAVDYLTRFLTGDDLKESFEISLIGAVCAEKFGIKDSIESAI